MDPEEVEALAVRYHDWARELTSHALQQGVAQSTRWDEHQLTSWLMIAARRKLSAAVPLVQRLLAGEARGTLLVAAVDAARAVAEPLTEDAATLSTELRRIADTHRDQTPWLAGRAMLGVLVLQRHEAWTELAERLGSWAADPLMLATRTALDQSAGLAHARPSGAQPLLDAAWKRLERLRTVRNDRPRPDKELSSELMMLVGRLLPPDDERRCDFFHLVEEAYGERDPVEFIGAVRGLAYACPSATECALLLGRGSSELVASAIRTLVRTNGR